VCRLPEQVCRGIKEGEALRNIAIFAEIIDSHGKGIRWFLPLHAHFRALAMLYPALPCAVGGAIW